MKDERCQGDDTSCLKLDEMHVPRDNGHCSPSRHESALLPQPKHFTKLCVGLSLGCCWGGPKIRQGGTGWCSVPHSLGGEGEFVVPLSHEEEDPQFRGRESKGPNPGSALA